MATAVPCRGVRLGHSSPLVTACQAHLQHLADRHYAETTRAVLETYRRHLLDYRKPNGTPLSLASQHARLTHLRVWCAWLTRAQYLPADPAVGLELPRVEYQLPAVCGVADAERVLQQPDLAGPVGIRDRALLETFYSTGMRRTELIGLALSDLDWGRRLVLIRQGKGRRDRVVPIGPRALGWVARYLAEVRPRHVRDVDAGTVFLTTRGHAFRPNHLSALVRHYVEAAQLGKRGACYLFRHTMATLMLEGGADIRFTQEMLGHADLTSTQRYTHVSIQQLQAVHAATHPAARLPVPQRRRSRPRRRPDDPWWHRRPSRRR